MVRHVCVLSLVVKVDHREFDRVESRGDQAGTCVLACLHLPEHLRRIIVVGKCEMNQLREVDFVVPAADMFQYKTDHLTKPLPSDADRTADTQITIAIPVEVRENDTSLVTVVILHQ